MHNRGAHRCEHAIHSRVNRTAVREDQREGRIDETAIIFIGSIAIIRGFPPRTIVKQPRISGIHRDQLTLNSFQGSRGEEEDNDICALD